MCGFSGCVCGKRHDLFGVFHGIFNPLQPLKKYSRMTASVPKLAMHRQGSLKVRQICLEHRIGDTVGTVVRFWGARGTLAKRVVRNPTLVAYRPQQEKMDSIVKQHRHFERHARSLPFRDWIGDSELQALGWPLLFGGIALSSVFRRIATINDLERATEIEDCQSGAPSHRWQENIAASHRLGSTCTSSTTSILSGLKSPVKSPPPFPNSSVLNN